MSARELGSSGLWEAVKAQADTWSCLPVVRQFAAQLPRNARLPLVGLTEFLQHVLSGSSAAGKKPMRMGTDVYALLSVTNEAPGQLQGSLEQWMNHARSVEIAHRLGIAWLRSRLPRYPWLPAPQLAVGTPLTTMEFSDRLPWTRGELREGLQFQNPPVEVLQSLGATPAGMAAAAEDWREVLSALCATGPWQRFLEADRALSAPDLLELKAARASIAELLIPTRLDAFEPNIVLDRLNFRHRVVADKVGSLAGAAREYADAFAELDGLIELACSDVFGQLCVYGTPRLDRISDLAINSDGAGHLEFGTDFMPWIEPGAVCWLDDELVGDAVYLTGLRFNFDQAAGMKLMASGRLLAGTSTAWKKDSTPTA